MATNRERFAVARENALKAVEAANLEEAQKFRTEAESLKGLIEAEDAVKGMTIPETEPLRPPLPGVGAGPTGQSEPETNHAEELQKAVNVLRFGPVLSDPESIVMREIYGADYRQLSYDAMKSFMHYVRTGRETRGMGRQVWGIDDVTDMLQKGQAVAEIKATMVEGQDVLGGYAVPPQYGTQIIQRVVGLTAIRRAGAMVIQTNSASISWLKLTGGGSQYVTGMRGYWGGETADPTETNFSYGLEQIPVHVYTYKVPFSVSLVEDATNLSTVFMQLVSSTMAIDDDEAFVNGDGANKPRGLLPGGANADSLSEVNSGAAAAVTWAGLRALRRGIGSQYRQAASWVMESDTAGDIEVLVDGMSRPYFEYVDDGERFMRQPLYETESMPTATTNTFPILYGDFSAYWIVERTGIAIQRYNDSGTGINVVEFQVRRRIGGRVTEPWKLVVQKCST